MIKRELLSVPGTIYWPTALCTQIQALQCALQNLFITQYSDGDSNSFDRGLVKLMEDKLPTSSRIRMSFSYFPSELFRNIWLPIAGHGTLDQIKIQVGSQGHQSMIVIKNAETDLPQIRILDIYTLEEPSSMLNFLI